MSNIADENVATTKRSYSKIYQQYVSSNSSLNDDVKRSLDQFISLISGKAVLDIGCAGGLESKYLHDHGLTVTGCDISEDFVHAARQLCPACDFFVADMRHLPLGPQSLNGIWANASFLHIPKSDALATLKQFHGILGSDGVLYLSVMRGEFDGLRENKQMKWPERHFSDYQENELANLLTGAGFQIVDRTSNTTHWGPTFLHFFAKK